MDNYNHLNNCKQIVCAIRCTPESYATMTRAIDLALEYDAKLTFLHVIDVEFLTYANITHQSDVYKELLNRCEFAMLMACDRAMRRGVRQVNYLIREGDVRKQLLELVHTQGADLVVMGHPHPNSPLHLFEPGEYEDLAVHLQDEAGIQVMMM
jgi:nucleotide-binding universal stress UspA family protein